MRRRGGRNWFLPETPDVIGMLVDQARVTVDGMNAFAAWAAGDEASGLAVRDFEHAADTLKRALADTVREAFTTPRDPEDLFELSRGLDEVLNGAKNTVREAEALELEPDEAMADMARCLAAGVVSLHDAFSSLGNEHDETAGTAAAAAVKAQRDLERAYRKAMSALLRASDDLREVVGRQELYRRLSEISEKILAVADRVGYSMAKET